MIPSWLRWLNLSLTVSKYRIEVTSSFLKNAFEGVFHGIALFSLFLWQPFVVPVEWMFQAVLATALLTSLIQRIRQNSRQSFILTADNQGQCYFSVQQDSEQTWQVARRSMVSFFALWICLESAVGAKRLWLCIARDQVSDQSFRRLCRIVFYCQQSTKPDK